MAVTILSAISDDEGIIKTVRNLLGLGTLSTSEISKISGLSVEEVEELKNQI